MKLCDMHIHSENSFDGESSVDDLCRAAEEAGFYAIAVTDHCEAPFINCVDCEFGDQIASLKNSSRDVREASEKYRGRLKVLRGIELGEPMHDAECTAAALEAADYDFILASVHNLKGREDFYYLDFTQLDVDKILNLYFDELAETAGFEHFDSLAHLTYPLRYIKSTTGSVPDLEPYQDKIDLIYKILIENGKALELNVSGLFKELGQTLPDAGQIRRFRSLGGKYLTIGTDAHVSSFVGKGIEKGIAIAKEAGFTHYTIYENHKPVMIEID